MSSLRNIAFASGIEILTDGDLAVRLMAGSALANRRSALRRGVSLDALGAPDQALESYRKAVSLDRRAVSFRLRLGQTLWETGGIREN